MAAEAKAREKAAKAEEGEREKEAQRAAEREAKRYPMEDLALLAELQAKAAAAGAIDVLARLSAPGPSNKLFRV